MVENHEYDPTESATMRSGEINIFALFASIRRRKAIFLATLASAIFLAILYLHVITPTYTVTLQVIATAGDSGQLGGRLGALSSLTGIDLGESSGTTSFKTFLAAIQSPLAAEILLKTRPDLIRLMFPTEWSASERHWKEPEQGPLRIVINGIKSLFGIAVSKWSPPSTDQVYKFLSSAVDVIEDPKSPIVKLQMQSSDAHFATSLLVALRSTLDEYLRQRMISRTSTYVKYLTQKLSTVTIEEYRQALLQNLTEQEKALMTASSSVAYDADMLGEPVASAQPTSPRPMLTLLLALVLGTVVGIVLALGAEKYRLVIRWPHFLRQLTPQFRPLR
jgi:LPS O-antigen subunit length determinant protein (WzzB/FepE family)